MFCLGPEKEKENFQCSLLIVALPSGASISFIFSTLCVPTCCRMFDYVNLFRCGKLIFVKVLTFLPSENVFYFNLCLCLVKSAFGLDATCFMILFFVVLSSSILLTSTRLDAPGDNFGPPPFLATPRRVFPTELRHGF